MTWRQVLLVAGCLALLPSYCGVIATTGPFRWLAVLVMLACIVAVWMTVGNDHSR